MSISKSRILRAFPTAVLPLLRAPAWLLVESFSLRRGKLKDKLLRFVAERFRRGRRGIN